jgi:peroxiredoxin Q/BCP
MPLKIGTTAPDFTLKNSTGEVFQLSKDWAGKPGIIYFYPKDFTPGCTVEACAFRDHYEDLVNWGIPIVGISTDSVQTHRKFKQKYNIQFDLLSDESGQVVTDYHAKLPFLNIAKRVTYIIDQDHKVQLAIENFLVPDTHIKEALLHLKQRLETIAG